MHDDSAPAAALARALVGAVCEDDVTDAVRAYRRGVRASDDAALDHVADLCTVALARCRATSAERAVVLGLQRLLRGPPPSLPGLDVAARCVPANDAPGVGGDWYELFAPGSGRIAIVVGDIAGRGASAAAAMVQARGLVGALLHSGLAVDEVMPRASQLLRWLVHPRSVLATAASLVVEPARDTVVYATAGHPPPLLRLPGGEVRALDEAMHPILGVPHREGRSAGAPFPAGAALVAFTDGLVDVPGAVIDDGIATVARYLRSPRLDAAGAETILGGVLDASPAMRRRGVDDLAVVVAVRSG
jgi:hypothetical protein